MSRGSKPGDTQGKAYHHGNLRNALIVAAAELIEENKNRKSLSEKASARIHEPSTFGSKT